MSESPPALPLLSPSLPMDTGNNDVRDAGSPNRVSLLPGPPSSRPSRPLLPFQLSGFHLNLSSNVASPSGETASTGSVKKYYRAAHNR